jgi:hypothetical protein
MTRQRYQLLPPRPFDWEMRSVSSAEASVRTLEDGRKELLIRHEELEAVTPEMLLWWFHHLDETMEWHGAIVPRYHVWHPIDHIQFTVERRAADGSVGPGAKWHIVEAFGGNLDFLLDESPDVVRLDTGGITLEGRALGQTLLRLEHTFTPTLHGTRYETRMRLGLSSSLLRPISRALIRRRFSDAKAEAWLKHNVEEVGNLPHFLPQLYASKAVATK